MAESKVFEQRDYCRRCGRTRGEHVQHRDNQPPHCPTLEQPTLEQPLDQKTRLCCACGTERDAAQDRRLELMADGGFRSLQPAPLAEPPSNEMLRSCRGCGAIYLPVKP